MGSEGRCGRRGGEEAEGVRNAPERGPTVLSAQSTKMPSPNTTHQTAGAEVPQTDS